MTMLEASLSATVPALGPAQTADLARFQLFAPGKRSVAVVADWNGWRPQADPLLPDPSGWWRLDKRLPPGRYRYQFVIDGEQLIADPYARAIERRGDNAQPAAIHTAGQPGYLWRHARWPRPAWRDLVIYELNVRDFSCAGTFEGARRRLAHLQHLGINAVELMPVHEPASTDGWGYNPAYFFAVRREFGTADELKALIDGAHARGIAVIIDIVLAHTAHRHPFSRMYPYEVSPWYGPGCGKQNEFGFPMLDFSKPATQEFASELLRYWLTEFHVDGLRFDYCPGIGRCGPHGLPLLARVARAVDPEVYLIAEYLPEEPNTLDGCDMDAAWHSRGTSGIHALLSERDYRSGRWGDFGDAVRFLDPAHEGYERASIMVNYVESHDEERIGNWLRGAGLNPAHVEQKMLLAAAVLLTAPGVPMLYQGQEWGEDTWRAVNRPNPLHWQALASPRGRELFEHYRRLIALRRAHPALRGEGFEFLAIYPESKCVVFRRWADEGAQAVVAFNFARQPQSVTLPFPRRGRWRELLTGQTVDTGGETAITLPPASAEVYLPLKDEG